ncbi:MAG TPA: cyclic nucleotide-binding domain-containing protein [Vicinamibacteria bacterium]|nr:cyclic nucleotide-binding domain-containing protein [Vicinamibacteria bacterium]
MPEGSRVLAPLQRILYLKSQPTLATLPAAELAVVAEQAQERFFPAGSVLLREGQPVGAVYFVVDGALAVHRRGAFVGRVKPGAGVGGLSLFARDPEGVQAVAETDTLAIELDADTVLEVLEDRFQILHHILRDFCRQVVELSVRRRLDLTKGFPEWTLRIDPGRELDLVERIFFLRQMQAFQRASINALAELSRALTQVRFEPEVTLWSVGEPAPGIYLILSGQVRATSEARGLSFRPGPGFPLGALEAMAEVPRWYDATTETPLVALQGSVEAVIDVFEDNFEMAMDFLQVTAQAMLEYIESRGPLEGPAAADL